MRSSLVLSSSGFSSSSLRTSPCSINSCGLNVTNGRRTCLAKKVPDEDGWLAYPGWSATFSHNGFLGFTNNQWESGIAKHFSSPPFVTLPRCQIQIVTNVTMSSSSPHQDEDCVVAVKILGPQLSFYRPAPQCKFGWTNIRIENPCFYSSEVMFSKLERWHVLYSSMWRPYHRIMGSPHTQANKSKVAVPKPSRADQDPTRASGILLLERILNWVTINRWNFLG